MRPVVFVASVSKTGSARIPVSAVKRASTSRLNTGSSEV
jgi:hypothetical protein